MADPARKAREPRSSKAESSAQHAPRRRVNYAALETAAAQGQMPPAPDFTAPTHARFRAVLARLIELAEAGDVDELRAVNINPVSSSPRAMARYRDLCVIALKAQKGGEK